jgi:ATP adenylyltransferase
MQKEIVPMFYSIENVSTQSEITEHNCELCEEFQSRKCKFIEPQQSRIIYETINFIVLPSLGSFVEGYLLICPKFHIPSFASIELDKLHELKSLISEVKRVVNNNYGSSVIFEHGVTSCGLKAGGCIDHAHLHIVPVDLDITTILESSFQTHVLTDWDRLNEYQNEAYLLAQSPNGRMLITELHNNVPSQFFRRHIASFLEIEERWDWGAYHGATEMIETIQRLRPQFTNNAKN